MVEYAVYEQFVNHFTMNKLFHEKEEDGRRVQAKSQGMLDAPNLKLTISKEGFIARGVKLFNVLPPHIRTEPTLPKFRSMMRKWIIENIPARPT